jgi:hypothetical protein
MSDSYIDRSWESVPRGIQTSLAAGWRNGMPATASALYGRWWQLETWLRSLVYVELRAAYGPEWANQLPPHAEKRQGREADMPHMHTPDASAQLAYTDATALFDVIEQHWQLFEPSLLPNSIWHGRVDELRHIRNRIGHCRRPHADDLPRLEQTLRDLEAGAFRAIATYNRRLSPSPSSDPVYEAWGHRRHEDAMRLVTHAAGQYQTQFRLSVSRRPKSTLLAVGKPVSGVPGYLWHASWFMGGNRELDLRGFWDDWHAETHREHFVLACASSPSDIEVSFSAVDDPTRVADAIGGCFDAVLRNLQPRSDLHLDLEEIVRQNARWIGRYGSIDARLQPGGLWSIVDDSTTPISIFAAEATAGQ